MMTKAAARWLLTCLLTASASSAVEPPCTAAPGRTAVALAGEVAGVGEFRAAVGPGLTFALVHAPEGWQIRLFDGAGLDLTQLTPPYRFAPNPRDLFGWHFRNEENTGPNDGSVNAPQRQRLFIFDPALSGTGGFKPSADTAAMPEGAPGRGLLTIEDLGLADLEKGQRARMVFLKFSACLSWPEPARVEVTPAVTFAPEIIERFGACGLAAPHQLTAFLQPLTLAGDFDGDGAHDLAAPVARTTDGKRGLAICRAGTYLDLLGFAGEMGELVPAYFDHIDGWTLHPRGPVGQSAEQGPPPTLRGDAIVIGKDDSSSVLIYWTGTRYHSYWQGD